MRLLLAIAFVLLLCGFPGCSGTKPTPPIAAQCDAVCFVPCVGKDGDTGIHIDSAPSDPNAWDEIADKLQREAAGKLRTCDARRDACAKCLKRLDAEKVIVL